MGIQQEPDPNTVIYPEHIRDIVEKLERREDLTFEEANLVVEVLNNIHYDVSELLIKSIQQLRHSLSPVIRAAEFLRRITGEQDKQDGSESPASHLQSNG